MRIHSVETGETVMDAMDVSALERAHSWRLKTASRKVISAHRRVSSTSQGSEKMQLEFLQNALTHQTLNSLGVRQWNVAGVEDARQVVSDRLGHRDGPVKTRRPPAELRLLDGAHWQDLPIDSRSALIAGYFEYLDIDEQRGPLVFGKEGWEAVRTACDLIIEQPSTVAAVGRYSKRSAYGHPVIRRRVDTALQVFRASLSRETVELGIA
jgi:hypothetical protein